MKKLLALLLLLPMIARGGTVSGNIQTASVGGVANGTLSFTLNQVAVVSGTAQVVGTSVQCYTSTAGAITGEPDPQVAPVLSVNLASGTLTAGTYFVKISYFDGTGESLASPESSIALASTGTIIVNPPAVQPANATGWRVYISAATGTETRQTSITGFGSNFQQTSALSAGTALPGSNTSSCSIRFTDEMIPSTTYYTVNMVNSAGSKIAGYPMSPVRFYGGTNGNVNVSSGWPLSVGGVVYPVPIVSTPNANGAQSISSPLDLGTFDLRAGFIQNRGYIKQTETTAPTCALGFDFIWGDSAAHREKVCDNNGAAVQLVHSGGDINTNDQVATIHLGGGAAVSAYQGNGTKAQLSIGTTTTNNFVSYDTNGNTVDSGKAQPSGAVVGDTDSQTVKNKILQSASSGNSVTLLNSQDTLANLTGNGSDQTVYTYTIPANTIQAGKGIRIRFHAINNNATAVTYKFKLGTTTLSTIATSAANNNNSFQFEIFNNAGVQTAQRFIAFGFDGTAVLANTTGTAAENTSNALALTVTASEANPNTIAPDKWIVELIQ